MLYKEQKLLSVCIPTYEMNEFGYIFLKHSLDILVKQTFKDFNVVISDHSKTDLIRDLCNEYKDMLDIHYFRNTENIGNSSANINNAIKKAGGKLIKILFQDDFLYGNNSLEDIAKNFDLEKDHWLVTACKQTKDGVTFFRPFYPKYNNKIYLGNNTISSPSVLTIKNNNPLLFDEKLIWLMDCDYYKRCYEAFGKPKIFNSIIVVNRIGDHQVSNTKATKLVRENEYDYILKKYSKKDNISTRFMEKYKNYKKYFKLENYIFALRSIMKKTYKKSYSQMGEDLIIKHIFDNRGIKKPSYMDIGAYDPAYINNTKIFYDNGSRGINIEPNTELYNKFVRNRKKDINLNIGISDSTGKLDFYILSIPTLSTFSKEEAERMIQEEKLSIKKIQRIPVVTIKDIVNKHCHEKFPDFLSIDAEGVDEKIIHSIDFKNGPKVICIETITYSTTGKGEKNRRIIEFLQNNGYIVFADTNINTIFVKKDFWEI